MCYFVFIFVGWLDRWIGHALEIETVSFLCVMWTVRLITIFSVVPYTINQPQALKPHIFVSVPRLWNRIYDRVMATMREANPVKRRMFETAFAYKRAALEAGAFFFCFFCVPCVVCSAVGLACGRL